MLKFPRYTREQNLACKLTDDNIRTIRTLRENQIPVIQIANRFKITQKAVYYWLLSSSERRTRNKRQYMRWGKLRNETERKEKRLRQLKSKSRKYRLMSTFREYCKRQLKKYRSKKYE